MMDREVVAEARNLLVAPDRPDLTLDQRVDAAKVLTAWLSLDSPETIERVAKVLSPSHAWPIDRRYHEARARAVVRVLQEDE